MACPGRARLGHLALHAGAYADHPLLMFDIRDGGWNFGFGVLTGLAALAWTVRRHPAWRGVLVPVVLGVTPLMFGAGAVLDRLTPDRLPPLALPSLNLDRPADVNAGSDPDLAAGLTGHPAVVVLWASWCGVCRQELPLLQAARQRYPQVRFVFVNQGEDLPTVTQAARSWALPATSVRLDPGSRLGRALGSNGLPTTLFLDARGQRVHVHPGLLTAAGLTVRLGEICPDC